MREEEDVCVTEAVHVRGLLWVSCVEGASMSVSVGDLSGMWRACGEVCGAGVGCGEELVSCGVDEVTSGLDVWVCCGKTEDDIGEGVDGRGREHSNDGGYIGLGLE